VVTCLTARSMRNFKFSTRFIVKLSLYSSLELTLEYVEAESIAFFRGPCNSQLVSPADCNDFIAGAGSVVTYTCTVCTTSQLLFM
jgi:hypothetical protein